MAEHAAVDEQWRVPDELWERIEPLLPEERPHPKGGRPWIPARKAMDAIFYVLRTVCQWKALPRSVGAGSTVHDRFQAWREAGLFHKLWQEGLIEFDANIGIDWEWQAMVGAMTKAPLGEGKNRLRMHHSGKMLPHQMQTTKPDYPSTTDGLNHKLSTVRASSERR